MKAIFLKKNGFKKEREVYDMKPWFSLPLYAEISISASSEINSDSITTDFYLERSFINEYGEKTLIYKEL